MERGVYARQGNLRKTFDVHKEIWNIYKMAGEPPYLRPRTTPIWDQIWAGRYAELEREYRPAIEVLRSTQDVEQLVGKVRELALCLGLQGKCNEALALAEEGLSLVREFGKMGELGVFIAPSRSGIVNLKCGKLDSAEEYLLQAITLGQKLHAHLDIAPIYLAAVYEIRRK